MRIAYVYDAVYPWEIGGIQKRVWELARRLAKSHDVHWYSLQYWDGPAVIERESVTLHGVTAPSGLYADRRRSITETLRYTRGLLSAIQDIRADVIDCQAFPYFPAFPSKAASLTDHATFAFTWHEVWRDYWYEYLGRPGVVGKAIEATTARLPDVHLAVSEGTANDVRELGVESVRISPNGIESKIIDEIPPAPDGADVLFVGRLIREKQPALVIQAVDRLREAYPGITCSFIGEGPEEPRLRSLIAERGLSDHVRLHGFLDSYGDVIARMKAADVFVLPSRREGFGITALEALACGTPVVTIEHSQNATTELIEDGTTGVVVDATSTSIATAIERARTDICPADCRNKTMTYEWSTVAADLETIYREVV